MGGGPSSTAVPCAFGAPAVLPPWCAEARRDASVVSGSEVDDACDPADSESESMITSCVVELRPRAACGLCDCFAVVALPL